MKKLFFYVAAVMLTATMASCNNSKKANTATAADSIQVDDMHNAENALDFYGEYKGTIPAADCPGIDVTLVLSKDNTFTCKMVYQEREGSDFDDSGTFTIDSNILTLASKDGGKTFYKVSEGRVEMLNADKQPAEGAMKDKYVLTQEKVY